MNQQITALYLDPRHVIEMLHYSIGPLLKKPEPTGLFLPWGRKPAICFGNQYFTVAGHGSAQATKLVPVANFSEVKRDIYDIHGRVVVRGYDAKLLVSQPRLPQQEFELVEALIDATIKDLSAWIKKEHKPDPYDVAMSFFINEAEYYSEPREFEYERHIHRAIAHALHVTETLLIKVARFIGEDNWLMHHRMRSGNDIVIEKGIDFRIHEYTRLKDEGIIP